MNRVRRSRTPPVCEDPHPGDVGCVADSEERVLEEPFVEILAALHWARCCCRWNALPNRWILSFLKEREGT